MNGDTTETAPAETPFPSLAKIRAERLGQQQATAASPAQVPPAAPFPSLAKVRAERAQQTVPAALPPPAPPTQSPIAAALPDLNLWPQDRLTGVAGPTGALQTRGQLARRTALHRQMAERPIESGPANVPPMVANALQAMGVPAPLVNPVNTAVASGIPSVARDIATNVGKLSAMGPGPMSIMRRRQIDEANATAQREYFGPLEEASPVGQEVGRQAAYLPLFAPGAAAAEAGAPALASRLLPVLGRLMPPEAAQQVAARVSEYGLGALSDALAGVATGTGTPQERAAQALQMGGMGLVARAAPEAAGAAWERFKRPPEPLRPSPAAAAVRRYNAEQDAFERRQGERRMADITADDVLERIGKERRAMFVDRRSELQDFRDAQLAESRLTGAAPTPLRPGQETFHNGRPYRVSNIIGDKARLVPEGHDGPIVIADALNRPEVASVEHAPGMEVPSELPRRRIEQPPPEDFGRAMQPPEAPPPAAPPAPSEARVAGVTGGRSEVGQGIPETPETLPLRAALAAMREHRERFGAPPTEVPVEVRGHTLDKALEGIGEAQARETEAAGRPESVATASPAAPRPSGESGKAPISLATGGVAPFIEHDVGPAAFHVSRTLVSTARQIRDLFSPASAGKEAATTAETIRAHAGTAARRWEQTVEEVKHARAYFDKQTPQHNVDFFDAVEGGRPPANRQLAPAAASLRNLLDEARDRVRHLGTGKLEHFYQNYMPHLWQDTKAAASWYARIGGKRPFEGPKSFLRTRTIPTLKDGIAAGLKPVTTNPVEATLLRLREMNRYVMAHDAMRELKGHGLARFQKATRAVPDGWTKVDDRMFTVYGGVDKQGALRVRGHWIMPEPAARVMNQYLSPGMRGRVPIYDALSFVGNTMNQAQLGMSAFHLMFTGVDAATSKVALGLEQLASGRPIKAARSLVSGAIVLPANVSNIIRGDKVLREYLRPGTQGAEIAQMASALERAGGRVRMDTFYKTGAADSFMKALRRGNVIGAAVRAPFAALDVLSRPIMEQIVPRQKLGVFADLARHELDRLGPGATDTQTRAALAKVWDSVDNRMGQLVYDNLFWPKVIKDLGMVSTRSLGWNLGTVRELGGAAKDIAATPFRMRSGSPALTHRMAYAVALPFTVGTIGAVLHYLYNGRGPAKLEDYFHVPTGATTPDGKPEKIEIASYMKDLFAYAHHPGRTISHKLHPLVGTIADMLRNEDFYGREVRHPGDPLVKQVADSFKFIASQYEPFSSRFARQRREAGEGLGKQAQSAFGITPVAAEYQRTPAENMMVDIMKRKMPRGPKTQAEADYSKARRDLITRVKRGAASAAEIRAFSEEHGLSRQQRQGIGRAVKEPRSLASFKQLEADEAFQVWAAASPDERREWRPAMRAKVVNYLKLHQGAARREMLDRARREGILEAAR